MTVYEPGGECLTRIQHDQREFRKQIQGKYAPSSATAPSSLAGGNAAATGAQLPEAVKPPQAGDKAATAYGSPHSQYLDISA